MADSGVQSPLGINVLGAVLKNTGLTINPIAASYMGASKNNTDYTLGSLVQSTVLYDVTRAINAGYGVLSNTIYDNLISIGKGTIPALGNSIPPTYLAQDPAGIWTTVAQNVATQHRIIPPMPCPATSGYAVSYSNMNEGQDASWLPYNTTNPNKSITRWGYIRLHALQAWIEFNWNGNTITDTATAGSFKVGTTYTIITVGSTNFTAIGATSNTAGVVFTATGIGSGSGTAYYSYLVNGTPAYDEFCSSFTSYSAVADSSNKSITSIGNSNTFMQGVYSNMNDLISADIAGVNLSSVAFGNDLISQGNLINLKNIETFGLPSNLLATLGQYYAITPDLILALLAAGMSRDDITSITTGADTNISAQTEQQIYGAFLIISGENLIGILSTLKCTLPNITTLADLLNLKFLFPTSYASLTVPIYNADSGPTNSKTYYPIYQDGGVNTSLTAPAIQSYVGTIIPSGTPPTSSAAASPQNYSTLPIGFDSYLNGIIPADQAVAAGAFSHTMQQIKNIKNVDILKLAKVAQGIENTTDLPLVAGTDKPTAQSSIDSSKQVCSLGSGPSGSYTMSDFFGCMSGLPYPWHLIQERINQLATSNLSTIYANLYNAVLHAGPVQTYIDQANAEIAAIQKANPEISKYLNTYWNICGDQLAREQRARYTNLPPVTVPKDNFLNQYPSSLYNFVNSIPTLALDTLPHMSAQTLEAISDITNLGGQSIIAMMRQERNQARLQTLGIDPDNNIADTLTPIQQQTLMTNGTIPGAGTSDGGGGITSPNGNVYTFPAWPAGPVPIGITTPVGTFETLTGLQPGDITSILDGSDNPVVSTTVPVGPATNTNPSDLALVIQPPEAYDPNNLPPKLNPKFTSSTLLPASPSVSAAIEHVVYCNCDCWVQ
jgi:hypothetical protein